MDSVSLLAPPPMGSCLGMAEVPGFGASLADSTSEFDRKNDKYMETLVALGKSSCTLSASSSPSPVASSIVCEPNRTKTHVLNNSIDEPPISAEETEFPHHVFSPIPGNNAGELRARP